MSKSVFRPSACVMACLLALQGPLAVARTRRAATPPAAIAFSAYNAHPRLVVIVVIDQFRGDYLDRYHADFKGRGFRLFLDNGAYFPDCYYDYANTKTAPGHATLGTGAYTDGHGIASNEWWDLNRNKDRPVSSVEDERYRQIGVPGMQNPAAGAAGESKAGAAPVPGASPRNLLASTLGDELRLATQGQSRVYGISLKDRAAILPAGSAANMAFWIDQASGAFVTSSYYAPQLPSWAVAFDTGGRAAQASSEAKTQDEFAASANSGGYPTGKGFYGVVGSTPAANSYELDFARALITGEQLGQHATTDLVTISLSANDIMGHQTGPDSAYQRQMVDGLDTDLDAFFGWLDKNVEGGLGNVWVALSADHGISPIPSEAAKIGIQAASVDLAKLGTALNDAINLKFSPGEKVDYLLSHQELPYLALNRPAFERTGVNEAEAEEAVQGALPAAVDSLAQPAIAPSPGPGGSPAGTMDRIPPHPTLVRSYTRLQLARGEMPATEFGRLIAHSYSPNGGWYVMTVFADYQMEALSGATRTNHFSPWSYDRHVPLGFYGAPFAPGVYRGRVEPVDLAATLASLLGLNQPSASVGRVLTLALKPAEAVSYPRPVVVRGRHVRMGAAGGRNSAAGAGTGKAASAATTVPASGPADTAPGTHAPNPALPAANPPNGAQPR